MPVTFFKELTVFNFFGGEIELKLMSKMGYNAATLGNHEFDNGVDHLANSLENANFGYKLKLCYLWYSIGK